MWRRSGGEVADHHDPAHVEGARAVVYTAAVPVDHPELARARELGIPVIPRKEALAGLVAGGTVVGLAGTHGKTTTTVMTTEALAAAGLAPTGLAGGRVGLWGGNARLDGDSLFVVEADEYDKAFLALHPTVAVVNNVEADHLECYGSYGALEEAFATFAGRARIRLIGVDDVGAARLATRLGPGTLRFGMAAEAELRIFDVRQAAAMTIASVALPGRGVVTLRLRSPRTAQPAQRDRSAWSGARAEWVSGRGDRGARRVPWCGQEVRTTGRRWRGDAGGRLRAPPDGTGGNA